MFSKYVLFKKGHLNKRAGVWTPWTAPGSATEMNCGVNNTEAGTRSQDTAVKACSQHMN